MVFCHESGEGGHPLLLKYLGVEPLLSLKMRLGEGTGAAVAWPIIRQSLDLYLNMNSFSSAKVTDSVAMLKQRGVDLHEYE
jgi:nicotinate-nucleotide--dimethylbenzimidazole phosphoribosyltransferase